MESIEESPLLSVIASLRKIKEHWQAGDKEMDACQRDGVEPASGLYEKLISDEARGPVRNHVTHLRQTLIPQAAKVIDPGLRDDLRALVNDLDPDSTFTWSTGDTTVRWRVTWSGLEIEKRFAELMALLHAQNVVSPDDPDSPRSSDKSEENWRLASWFSKHTGDALNAGRLWSARKAGNIKGRRPEGGRQWSYSVRSVTAYWPEHRDDLLRQLDEEA